MNQCIDSATQLQHTDNFQIDREFYDFVESEVLPYVNVQPAKFWDGFQRLIQDMTPRNNELLAIRDRMQAEIDEWHASKPDGFNQLEYKSFLQSIGYLLPEGDDFEITTANIDAEIASIAGPQLVVPVKNARFALNAANARWGSLYDALYGSDLIPSEGELAPGNAYNPKRGELVIARACEFLDEVFPLEEGSHADVECYSQACRGLLANLKIKQSFRLAKPDQLVAIKGDKHRPESIVLQNNGLHVELRLVDPAERGENQGSVIKDIIVESALTTIMDCEDSVAAVDPEDKIEVYRNWLGLNKGDLCESVSKNGNTIERRLKADRQFMTCEGEDYTLPGRSLMLVRNVGHLMTTSLMRTAQGDEVPEGIVDAVVTAMIAMIDLDGKGRHTNSRAGSIYIVKPKMHGPAEVQFTCDLFTRVEQLLGLPSNTIKLGIMDEERRTSVNLKECIRAARERVFFINTGFLDRTGDEIHTSMHAGAFMPKSQIKAQPWIAAYEDRNVDIGLACGFSGKAQIGKGMWPMPDEMAAMMEQKIGHPESGANTAWVPSPTAASLHALHYHQVDVFARQAELKQREQGSVDDVLRIPLMSMGASAELTLDQIEQELRNNIQGILGYVVRWIDQGVGCSKVPDINDIGLMEDRATLRISSQHIANWLHHGICTKEQVSILMREMAQVVDKQNAGDPNYQSMTPDVHQSVAFRAAQALILQGEDQPNGYTEPLLHEYRQQAKAQ